MNAGNERTLRLRAMAAASERRHRPRWAVVAGSLMVAVALAYTIIMFFDAMTARGALERRESLLARTVAYNDAIDGLDDPQAEAQRRRRYAPRSQFFTELVNVHRDLGIDDARIRVTEDRTPQPLGPDSDLHAKKFKVTFTAVPLEQAMEWLERALGQVDGMYVFNLDMIPNAGGWSVTIDLARWELRR